MTNHDNFAFYALRVIILLGVVFTFGWMVGGAHQCESFGMELYKGKCVVVTRQEPKP